MIISFIHFSDITRDNSSFLSRDLDILFPFFLPISLKVTDAKVIAESCTGFARILGYVIPIQPPNSRMYKRRLTGINGFSCRSNNSWNTLYQLIYFITKIAPLFWYTTRMVHFPKCITYLENDYWRFMVFTLVWHCQIVMGSICFIKNMVYNSFCWWLSSV